MLEHIAQFTAWPILTGIFIGYIANRIMSGEGKGCCMNLIVGIVGSYAGTFLGSLFDVNLLGAGYLKNLAHAHFSVDSPPCSLMPTNNIEQAYPKILHTLKKKNGKSDTPLTSVLRALMPEFRDSAFALVTKVS